MAELKSLTINGKSIYDLIYPVGSVYETESSTFDPNSTFGGTWKRISGKMLVGVDENDTDFKSSALTGGEKTHTLTLAEIPDHTHTQYVTSNSGTDGQRRDYDSDGGCSRYPQCQTGGCGAGGGAHNNMPPYYTVYIWRRTA